LEEFQAYNQNIVFEFINPLENEDTSMDNIKELYRKGLTPVNITVDDKGNNLRPWSSMGYSSISETKSIFHY
jgi:tartrate dehydratase beta subunit/fumarate hydratase class I family protein